MSVEVTEQTDPTEIVREEFKKIQRAKLEFEEVTIKLPKLIMNFLRKTEKNAIEWIELRTVDTCRADIEAMEPEHWVHTFQLGMVFSVILDDNRFVLP